MFGQENHVVKGLDPVADAFDGTVYSDVINMRDVGCASFILYKGVGATGTSTITCEACSDATGANPTAVEFYYRAVTTGDTPGTYTAAASTGFTTTAGSSQVYVVDVPADKMSGTGKQYLRLKAVESVNSPVLGGILIVAGDLRFSVDTDTTIIV
jgi:hypothetical protein